MSCYNTLRYLTTKVNSVKVKLLIVILLQFLSCLIDFFKNPSIDLQSFFIRLLRYFIDQIIFSIFAENVVRNPDIRNYISSSSPNKIHSINDFKNASSPILKTSTNNNIFSSSRIKNSEKKEGKSNNIVGFSDLTNKCKKSEVKVNIFGGEGKKLDSDGDLRNTGAIKKIPGFNNRFSEKTNSNKNVKSGKTNSSNKRISGSEGKKMGTYDKIHSSGTVLKNKGSTTFTINKKISNKSKIDNNTEPETKPLIPFAGSGHKLGFSDSSAIKHSNSNGDCKPISPLVYLYQSNSNITDNKTKENSEKYKNDFLNISVSDDELADIEEGNRNQANNVSPEKYKDDFLNISVSDDELVDALEVHDSQNASRNNVCSSEEYKSKFHDKTLSDDELFESTIDDSKFKGDDLVKCPVCNYKIHRDDMSIHLQSCEILVSTIENMNNSALLEANSDDEDECFNERDDEMNAICKSNLSMIPCPCCSKNIKESDINNHLDECLSLLAIKEFKNDW